MSNIETSPPTMNNPIRELLHNGNYQICAPTMDKDSNPSISIPTADGVHEEYCTRCDQEFDDADAGCNCGYCVLCDRPGSLCKCERCTYCGRLLTICKCSTCPKCDNQIFACACEPCDGCALSAAQCLCVGADTQRIRLTSNPIQVIRIQHNEDVVSGWSSGADNSVVLRGDLRNAHVFVIQSPTAVCRDVSSWISSKFTATTIKVVSHVQNWTQTFVETTDTGKWLEKKYNQFLWWKEPEVETSHINVKTKRGVRKMLRSLEQSSHNTGRPQIAFDCEGVDLGRDGITCYIQICNLETSTTYLVDLHTLGATAWNTRGRSRTLKNIFEDAQIIKLIYAVGSDADALYHHYGVRLQGILDLQYLYMLSHENPQSRRPNYDSAATKLPHVIYARAIALKRQGKRMIDNDPAQYELFLRRPLPTPLKAYAVNDVADLGLLAEILMKQVTSKGLEFAYEYSEREVEFRVTSSTEDLQEDQD